MSSGIGVETQIQQSLKVFFSRCLTMAQTVQTCGTQVAIPLAILWETWEEIFTTRAGEEWPGTMRPGLFPQMTWSRSTSP